MSEDKGNETEYHLFLDDKEIEIAFIEIDITYLVYEKREIMKIRARSKAKAEASQPRYETIHEDKKTKTTQKKKGTHKLEVSIAHETEKAYRIQYNGKLAWIPKKAIEDKNIGEGNFGTVIIADWFWDKLKWEEDDYEPITPPPTGL